MRSEHLHHNFIVAMDQKVEDGTIVEKLGKRVGEK